MINYIINKEDLANNLRDIRECFGVTQEHVAEILGIDRSTWNYYESGKTTLNIFKIIKLAKYFRIPVDIFLLKDGGLLELRRLHSQIKKEKNK